MGGDVLAPALEVVAEALDQVEGVRDLEIGVEAAVQHAVVASIRVLTSARPRKRSRQAPAFPVAITPIFNRARPARTTGTVHAKPLGAS